MGASVHCDVLLRDARGVPALLEELSPRGVAPHRHPPSRRDTKQIECSYDKNQRRNKLRRLLQSTTIDDGNTLRRLLQSTTIDDDNNTLRRLLQSTTIDLYHHTVPEGAALANHTLIRIRNASRRFVGTVYGAYGAPYNYNMQLESIPRRK